MNPARVAALLVAGLAALLLAGCRSAPAWMQNGMRAPEVAGRTIDGSQFRLSDERGKAVVVVFFEDWCPHCQALYPQERELAARMRGEPFVLVGVESDRSPAEMRSVADRERITWPVVHDATQANAATWGVTGLPTVYCVDARGVIRSFDERGSSLDATVAAMVAEARAGR